MCRMCLAVELLQVKERQKRVRQLHQQGCTDRMLCLDVGLDQLDQLSGTYESVSTLAYNILSLKTQCVRFSTILWSNSILQTVLMSSF